MSDVALFVAGSIVTAMVTVGLIALFYAAVLDGRTEQRRKSKGVESRREPEDRRHG